MTGRAVRVRAAAVVGALAALVLLPAAPASAHAYLEGSTPAAGTTVRTAPASVVLRFDETLLDLGSDAVTVTGPQGEHYETGCAVVDGRDVTTPVALGAAGEYTVAYRVVSADGHTVEDDYTFTSAVAAGGGGSATGPSCAAAPRTQQAATGTPAVLFAAIGISAAVLLAVLVLVVVVAVRIRRTPPA